MGATIDIANLWAHARYPSTTRSNAILPPKGHRRTGVGIWPEFRSSREVQRARCVSFATFTVCNHLDDHLLLAFERRLAVLPARLLCFHDLTLKLLGSDNHARRPLRSGSPRSLLDTGRARTAEQKQRVVI